MKRILSAVLAVLMIFALAGCGKDVKGTVKNKDQNAIFKSGKTDGMVYENTFLGVGCELPAGWTFYTDKQIEELNKSVAESADKDFADDLSRVNIIYDMSAYSGDGSAVISVTFEKMTEKKVKELDMEGYCKNTVKAFLDSYDQQGFTRHEGAAITAKIGTKECHGINVWVANGTQKVFTKSLFMKKGKYIACISANAKSQDTVDNLIKEFYLI
jgi:hypothetical protein